MCYPKQWKWHHQTSWICVSFQCGINKRFFYALPWVHMCNIATSSNTLHTFTQACVAVWPTKQLTSIILSLHCDIMKGVSHMSLNCGLNCESNQSHTFTHAHMSLCCDITKRAAHYHTHTSLHCDNTKRVSHIRTSSHDYSISPASVSDWFTVG